MTTAFANAQEMDGSPKEDLDSVGFRATREFMVDWSDRLAFMKAKVGGYGEVYPYFPGSGAHAKRATAKPFDAIDASGLLGVYERAIVTIEYRTAGDSDPQRGGGGGGGGLEVPTLINQSLEPGGEMLTLDHVGFRWKGPPARALNEDEAPAKFVPLSEYVLTLHRRRSLPVASDQLVGHVNKEHIRALFLGKEFAPQTLLYNSPFVDIHTGPEGQLEMTVTYRFTHRPSGWNTFWRKDKVVAVGGNVVGVGDWDTIWVSGGRDKWVRYLNHPEGDFTRLTV